MKLTYSVESFPTADQAPFFTAYLEGRLIISGENNQVIFDESGILLVELKNAIRQWLTNKDVEGGFVYESMDFEGVVLSFMVKDDRVIEFKSDLSEFSTEIGGSGKDLIDVLTEYCESLQAFIFSSARH